eukprot:TRINITY_DN2812_c0_g1_i2.p1 TRINITY_DN2812_c0_g1~~TRINITY_DN2812_c0_g1_i2.p1  ORF type:complete len:387 (+),score=77.68 TRINITY_DN2812_c0_g1_i2:208-1368(+)
MGGAALHRGATHHRPVLISSPNIIEGEDEEDEDETADRKSASVSPAISVDQSSSLRPPSGSPHENQESVESNTPTPDLKDGKGLMDKKESRHDASHSAHGDSVVTAAHSVAPHLDPKSDSIASSTPKGDSVQGHTLSVEVVQRKPTQRKSRFIGDLTQIWGDLHHGSPTSSPPTPATHLDPSQIAADVDEDPANEVLGDSEISEENKMDSVVSNDQSANDETLPDKSSTEPVVDADVKPHSMRASAIWYLATSTKGIAYTLKKGADVVKKISGFGESQKNAPPPYIYTTNFDPAAPRLERLNHQYYDTMSTAHLKFYHDVSLCATSMLTCTDRGIVNFDDARQVYSSGVGHLRTLIQSLEETDFVLKIQHLDRHEAPSRPTSVSTL